eukprot:2535667-Rhodomonas_salina.1
MQASSLAEQGGLAEDSLTEELPGYENIMMLSLPLLRVDSTAAASESLLRVRLRSHQQRLRCLGHARCYDLLAHLQGALLAGGFCYLTLGPHLRESETQREIMKQCKLLE